MYRDGQTLQIPRYPAFPLWLACGDEEHFGATRSDSSQQPVIILVRSTFELRRFRAGYPETGIAVAQSSGSPLCDARLATQKEKRIAFCRGQFTEPKEVSSSR